MPLPTNLACPSCKSKLAVEAGRPPDDAGVTCRGCGRSYPAAQGVIDFRVSSPVSEELGWSVETFEQTYAKIGDWESIYEWDQKRGIPRDASTYKYSRVKGWILATMKPKTGGRVLDLGCGNGYFLLEARRKFCAQAPGVSYLGLDASRHNILNLRQRARRDSLEQVHAILALGEALPFESGSIDLVVSSEALEHIGDKFAALREVHRVLSPGGCFLFTTPSLGGLRNWDRLMAPVIFPRRLLQGRLRRREPATGYDHPATRQEYARLLGKAGFATIDLKSAQLLNDEVTTRLPRFFLRPWISMARAAETNVPLMRRLFGLHITGLARKAELAVASTDSTFDPSKTRPETAAGASAVSPSARPDPRESPVGSTR